jgi:CTP:phosphocholine cytidylyltransferase-like protein
MNIIFLMAGEGRRFKQNDQQVVKPLIDVLGN